LSTYENIPDWFHCGTGMTAAVSADTEEGFVQIRRQTFNGW
jgi:hypothetical protein